MTLCCVETGETACQAVPCLPSVIKSDITTAKDDNNNNIQQPMKEEDDVRRMMSALGLKLKQQQKLVETASGSLIPIILSITPFKHRTRKKISNEKSAVLPLCLLSLKKYDARELIHYVVTELKTISIVKHYEKYCVTDNLKMPKKQTKRSVEKTSKRSVCPSQRQGVLRPKHKKDVGLNKRLQNCAVSENITLRKCEVVLQRLKRSYVEYLMQTRQVEYKAKSSSAMMKSKTAITSTTPVKQSRSRKKKCLSKRSSLPLNDNKPQSSSSTVKRKSLTPTLPSILNTSNTGKRQKMINIDHSNCIIENVTKAPWLQTVHPSKFDSICLKCFVCDIRKVLPFDNLAYDLHSHWQLHKKSNITYNIYNTVIEKKRFRMIEYFIPPQRPAMEGRPLNIFISHGQELKNQEDQVVIISDDDDEDIICLN
ncbi:unnamed protein product [Didymodactylos carnosus]|uniref:Uncharacterized protein n=1 Tax=Didymodactylos carnosus TaxID=1234261 RepID=A0A814E071_9BILA|nr:unnamed protein product [Didymodactylos carnosus]CAF0962856.1 unnamed protein product [Didymodactylos carnosus]CAF3684966.1 unnamed protein product [Didymodactylos carnosus]CAF3737231.1 unnamed protein product [Didymodactylos carnosus]